MKDFSHDKFISSLSRAIERIDEYYANTQSAISNDGYLLDMARKNVLQDVIAAVNFAIKE